MKYLSSIIFYLIATAKCFGSTEISLSGPYGKVQFNIPKEYKSAISVHENMFWIYIKYPKLEPVAVEKSNEKNSISILVRVVASRDAIPLAEMGFSNIQKSIKIPTGAPQFKETGLINGMQTFLRIENSARKGTSIRFFKNTYGNLVCIDDILDKVSVSQRLNENIEIKYIHQKDGFGDGFILNDLILNFINKIIVK